jgi:hypothetical protein
VGDGDGDNGDGVKIMVLLGVFFGGDTFETKTKHGKFCGSTSHT